MSNAALGRGSSSLRVTALLALAVVLVFMSSGCINAYWTKGVLNPEKKVPVFSTKEKVVQVHFFETNLTDVKSLESHASNTTTIKDRTQWMEVEIDVQMEPMPAWAQQLKQFLPINISRYVHIIITMPDGTAWYDKNFNETGKEIVDIETPLSGEWNFKVDAFGVGKEAVGFHDGYKVIAHAYEPN